MKSKMRVKDSPSALAFLSPTKRRIMSELVTARKNVKSKFKRAYTDRIKLEQDLDKVFKPVKKSIDSLKPKDKKDKKNGLSKANESLHERLETTPFKPSRFATSTPQGILNKKRLSYSDVFQTVAENTPNESNRTKNTPPPFIRSPHKTRSRARNLENFSYEVQHDDDDLDNYDYFPDENVLLDVIQTDVNTGGKKPIKMRYGDLPLTARKKWIKKRQQMGEILQVIRKKKALSFDDIQDDDDDDDMSNGGAQSIALQTSKRGKGIKSRGKFLDFNFIPYNVKNRVIYEYFDDPNELCDRLRLLVSSKSAGNSNHMQEINSIVEELRELKCIA